MCTNQIFDNNIPKELNRKMQESNGEKGEVGSNNQDRGEEEL